MFQAEESLEDVTFRLQLALGIPDLNIVKTWPIATEEEIELFKSQDETFSCWVDPNTIDPPIKFDLIVQERRVLFGKNLMYHLTHLPQPNTIKSNPEGKHFLLNVLVMPKKCQRSTSLEIPKGFDSVFDDTGRIAVKFVTQVLCVSAVEFELRALRNQVQDFICEMCEITLARWYCPSDYAHLCDACDQKHHETNPILSRHSRVLVTQSPFQFGYCSAHPSEKVNAVCTTCYACLCPLCESFNIPLGTPTRGKIILGRDSHQHTLVSTTDAYRESLVEINPNNKLTQEISNKYRILLNVYSNYKSNQDKLDQIISNLLAQLNNHFKRQCDYLNSRWRQLKLYSDTLDLLISFLEHVTLSLKDAEYIYFKAKFDLYVNSYMEKNTLSVIHPKWLLQPLEFWGGLDIESTTGEIAQRAIEFETPNNDYLDKYDLIKPTIPGVNQPTDVIQIIDKYDINSGLEKLDSYRLKAEDTAHVSTCMSNQVFSSNCKFEYNDNEVSSLTPSNNIYYLKKDSSPHTPLNGSKGPTPIVHSPPTPVIAPADIPTINLPDQELYPLSPLVVTPSHVDALWKLLSEHRHVPLISLVSACHVTKRVGFLHDLAKLANSYDSLHLLIHDYINYLKDKNAPEFLYLRSVGSLQDLLSWVLIGEYSTDNEWFETKLSELDTSYESLEKCIDKFLYDLSSGHIPDTLAWCLYQLTSSKLGTDLLASLSASYVTRKQIGGADSRHIAYSLSKIGILVWYNEQDGQLPYMTNKLHKGVERFLKLFKRPVHIKLRATVNVISTVTDILEPILQLKKEVYGETQVGSSQFDVDFDFPNKYEILDLVTEIERESI